MLFKKLSDLIENPINFGKYSEMLIGLIKS